MLGGRLPKCCYQLSLGSEHHARVPWPHAAILSVMPSGGSGKQTAWQEALRRPLFEDEGFTSFKQTGLTMMQ